MPRTPTERQLYDELLDHYGREVANAFLAAVDDLKKGADLQKLLIAIERGSLDEALTALHLDAAAFSNLLDQIQSGYTISGQTAASFIRAAAIVRFNARNPRAEQWLRLHSSALVTRILDDQRQAVRQALTAGMEKGQNPRTVALDIVGRVNKTSGKREGGILGLTAQQEEFVRNARAELGSGDPAQLKAYLSRARRDKRFDRAVQKAIREEAGLPADVAAKAARQYENRLLKLRGDMIGRTEALTSLRAAKQEAYLQAVDSGAIAESAVRRIWRDASDLRVRHTHRIMDGDSVGLREAFRSPSGARLMFPGDPSAPASEIVNCRCHLDYRVDRLSNLR